MRSFNVMSIYNQSVAQATIKDSISYYREQLGWATAHWGYTGKSKIQYDRQIKIAKKNFKKIEEDKKNNPIVSTAAQRIG